MDLACLLNDVEYLYMLFGLGWRGGKDPLFEIFCEGW
jgi:hypothetical protein